MPEAISSCATCCTTQVILCRCAHLGHPGADVTEDLASHLGELDVDLVVMDDLCALAATGDLGLAAITPGAQLTVVACEERAVRWLLAAAGAEIADDALTVHNLRRQPAAAILDQVAATACQREAAEPTVVTTGNGWLPWFPVIDRSRCTDCQQCASFCLFEVFNVNTQGQVQVAAPANCKPNCPACARVCPEGAIIFPKSTEASINGGEGDTTSCPVDLDLLLGDDPVAVLKQRRTAARARLLTREAMARAEAERERCACSSGLVLPTFQRPQDKAVQPCCASGGPGPEEPA